MLAANVVGPQKVELQEVPIPEVKDDEILISLEGCGVCGSSLPSWEGRPWFQYPFGAGAPGHEGWGHAAAVGKDVQGIKEGDRVAAISYRAFAEYDVANAANVVVLPPSLAEKDFPGEALACAMNIFERAQVQPGHRVAVVGVGFLGAVLVQLAARAGADVFGIARRTHAVNVAQALGAKRGLQIPEPADDAAVATLVESCGGDQFDVVIECAGQQLALNIATRLCKISGRLVIAGFHQDGLRNVDLCSWNWRALEIVNAHAREPQAYVRGLRQAVQAVAERRLAPDELYTHRFPLQQLGQAFSLLIERPPGFMKANVILREAA
jgi:threonine dehydrogenase-like Zn-dependent dehydrogenase